MKLLEKNNENYSVIFVVIMLLSMMNVFLAGAYLLAIAALIIVLKNFNQPYKLSFLPLLAFAFTYFLITYFHGQGFVASLKVFVCPLVWLMSYQASRKKSLGQVSFFVVILTMGMAAHGVLNFVYNVANDIDWQYGKALDIWSKTLSASTGQAVNFTMIIAIAFWAIMLQRKKLLKISVIILLILSLIYDILIGGRTFLVLFVIALLWGLFSNAYFSNPKMFFRRKMLHTLIIVLGISIVVVILFNNNVFGIKAFYEDSYLYKRITEHGATLQNDERMGRKLRYFSMIGESIWGGNVLSQDLGIGNAHELWLDILDDAGIIPYFFIVLYTICSTKRFVKICKNSAVSAKEKVLFSSLYVIIILQFFVEPILRGSPILLYSYIMIDASIARYINDTQNAKK